MTDADTRRLHDEALAKLKTATVIDHIVASYELKVAFAGGLHQPTDKDFHFNRALDATARFLGRRLTLEEMQEAGDRIDKAHKERNRK